MKGPEMIISEMELVGRLGQVEPLPDEAFDKARAVLQASMDVESGAAVPGSSQHPSRRRRPVLVRGGIAAGIAATAAAVALFATSTGPSAKVPAASNPVAPHNVATGPSQAGSPLIRLADSVRESAAPAGNATLVARTTPLGGGRTVTVYDLYTDNGRYFFSRTRGGLPGQVRAGHNLAGDLFAREIAAAKLAATGNLQTAGEDMAAAPDPGKYIPQTTTRTVGPLGAAKDPGVYHVGQVVGTLYDNYVWENSQDALIAGSGNPQVRAGVLRLIATLPDVTVTSGTSGGQPTLVLTAGIDETGGIQQVTINAATGIPISSASGVPAPGQALDPAALNARLHTLATTYQVTRVTTSDVAAGKF